MSDRPWPERADLQALVAADEVERARYVEVAVVHQAEGVVVGARMEDLVAAQRAARRRLGAARGLLTKAGKNGNAEAIAAAAARLEQTEADWDEISYAMITQSQALVEERVKHLALVCAASTRAAATSSAVLDALARPQRPENGS